MNVEVQAPEEFQGAVVGQLNQPARHHPEHRNHEGYLIASAHVPLSGDVRILDGSPLGDAGQGEYSMEFAKYQPVPRSTQEQMIKEFREKQAAAKK